MTTEQPLKSKLRIGGSQVFAHRMLRGFLNEYVRTTDIFASCISCRNFDAPGYWCKKYQQHPPADVIANSCIIGYDDQDDIPFHI